MNINDLLNYANEREISLSSAVFENYGSIDRETTLALLQEMAAIVGDNNESLLENLKEYHSELFEEE